MKCGSGETLENHCHKYDREKNLNLEEASVVGHILLILNILEY